MIDPTEINRPPEAPEPGPPKNLDIACGDTKPEGWIGIDIAKTPSVDIQHDLMQFPWPIESDSIDEARCSHFFEHVPQLQRPAFMSEVWRVLKAGAGCIFTTPRGYERQVQDFTHQWPPVVIASYLYYDREWIRANKLDHYIDLYGLNCDFEVRPMEVSVSPEWQVRAMEHKVFAINHYANAPVDLMVLLVKKGKLG